MNTIYKNLSYQSVELLPGILHKKVQANRKYLLSLNTENLLRNHYIEAGLWSSTNKPEEDIHWGWESPTCQLRGHFLGHWLSAAAMIYATTGDPELKGKADRIISELGKCQQENGGEWVGSIPEKYLEWIAKGKEVWAPQYTLHKTFMGLIDMYNLTGNTQALEIAISWANWFYRWSGQYSQEQFDDILDCETGGMLEIWVDLYAITGKNEHYELIQRYYRRSLFDPLLDGVDVLTNMHANTTIPEIIGAAKAWEVTGEKRWRDIVECYWKLAVTDRGTYCTGGQTCGEIWTPPNAMSARLGDKNQEHCTVYNMMRLAEFLFRWTADPCYADYWERNLYNGIMAQGHWEGFFGNGLKNEFPPQGLITYFLPLRAGSHKGWGSPTNDFWCCHGSLVQANATHNRGIYFEDNSGIAVCQYIPSRTSWYKDGTTVDISQKVNTQAGSCGAINQLNRDVKHRPMALSVDFQINCEIPVEFDLRIRIPWWIKGASIFINGDKQTIDAQPSTFFNISRVWNKDTVTVVLEKGLTVSRLPDDPDVVAFMEGPVVLAGLYDDELELCGDRNHPEKLLIPDNEREWSNWKTGYRTCGQDINIRFIPLYEVGYEKYSVYFRLRDNTDKK